MVKIIADTIQRKGEFLVSEANGELSREQGILAANNVIVDGQALKITSGKLVPCTGANTSGVSSETGFAGYAYGNYDSTGGDLKGVVYIARLAEVKAEAIKNHNVSGGGAANATLAVLGLAAARFIVAR